MNTHYLIEEEIKELILKTVIDSGADGWQFDFKYIITNRIEPKLEKFIELKLLEITRNYKK